MPRHILVFGGTSPTGIDFCRAALRDNHTLTLYVRNPSKLPAEISEHVTVVVGELTDAEAVEKAVTCGAKTCVSFIGPVLAKSKKGEQPITTGYKTILPLLQKHHYTRTLFISTPSYKAPQDTFSLIFHLMISSIKLFVPSAYAEINGMTPLMTALPSELNWTVFRVPALGNGDAGPVKAGFVGEKGLGVKLERKSMVEWVLVEMEKGEWIGKCPQLSNA